MTSHQVQITVAYDSDMQADFDDLRFTNATGTALDYWLETKTDSSSATVWVEVDSLTASSNTTIYMYYGNSGASSASNGDNTFLFFDDFEGSSLDTTNKWEMASSGGTYYADVSGSVFRQYATSGYYKVRDKPANLGINIVVEQKFKIGTYAQAANTNRNRLLIGNVTGISGAADHGIFDNSSNPTIQYYWGSYTGTATTLDTWLKNVRKVYGSTGSNNSTYEWTVYNYSTGTSEFSRSATATTTTPVRVALLMGDPGAGGDLYTDWVFVRNYASTEPTTSTGTEQQKWDSYESDYTTGRETYTGSYNTVYMKGTGFQDISYLIAYYDADGVKTGSETVSAPGGTLNGAYLLTSDQTAAPGTWHALVQPSSGYTGFGTNSYSTIVASPDTYGLLANDSFTVEASATPEFPTVIAGVAVAGLCAVIYWRLRRTGLAYVKA